MSNSGGSPNGNEESQNSESSSSNSGSSSSNSESSSSNSESSSSNSESSSSNSESSSSNSGSSSPPSGENSSPSDSSSNSPPSQDGPSSDSNSESSSSKSGSSSSPSESNPSPPSNSGSSSSPPNSDSGSSSSPPPPQSQSNSNSDSPPSESSKGSNSSPSNSNSNSSPSQSSEGSNSSPSNSNSSPSSSEGSQSQSPPTNSHKSSDNQQSGNPSRESPNSQASHNSPPSLSSRTSDRVPELSPPSTHSSHSSSTPTSRSSTRSSDSSDNSSAATVAGITAAGVLVIALISLLFVITRKKKRRTQDYYDPYGPPPPNFSVNADGYYYGPQYSQQQRQQHSQQHPQQHSQQYSMGMNSQEYYGAKPPPAPVGIYSSGSYRGPESGVLGGSKSCFTYEELMGITEGFSRKNVIGEGGFGAVYKGSLPDGKLVAVKQLKAGSGQGEREFRAEVEIISRVHHRHLVSLVGYCVAETQRLLVYEFVPNNTLEHHLHGQGVPMMEWSKRLKIAVGAARGLAYLHEDCHPKIIHRDIKSANILIDDVFEAQVADFGLARLSNDTSTHVSTRVMGTFGYMAPEYASSGKLTDRSDVFSFGVVLLELVTGRKPIDQDLDESLVEWARPVLQQARETGDYSELVDPRLEKRYVEEELIRMAETAAACVRHSAPKRPRMVQVLRALDTDGDMPDISNGVKVGQSTIFECGPNSDLQKFRMMAFGSDESSEYDMCSANFNSREMSTKPSSSWKSADSGELETRPINPRRGY